MDGVRLCCYRSLACVYKKPQRALLPRWSNETRMPCVLACMSAERSNWWWTGFPGKCRPPIVFETFVCMCACCMYVWPFHHLHSNAWKRIVFFFRLELIFYFFLAYSFFFSVRTAITNYSIQIEPTNMRYELTYSNIAVIVSCYSSFHQRFAMRVMLLMVKYALPKGLYCCMTSRTLWRLHIFSSTTNS